MWKMTCPEVQLQSGINTFDIFVGWIMKSIKHKLGVSVSLSRLMKVCVENANLVRVTETRGDASGCLVESVG